MSSTSSAMGRRWPTRLFVVANDDDACFGAPPYKTRCRYRVSRGADKRLANNKVVSVQGVPPVAAIAASGNRIAEVAANLRWDHWLQARPNAVVEIRDVRSGRVILRVHPRGEVRALGPSSAAVAVLARRSGILRLEMYDLSSGTGYWLHLIRAVEGAGRRLYLQGRVPGSFYDGRGQEATAVGAARAMGADSPFPTRCASGRPPSSS
jgi:hypothetical protein